MIAVTKGLVKHFYRLFSIVPQNDITARLMSFPQVMITSHQAFFTREALQAIAAETMENARNFLQGYPYGDAQVL